MIIKIANNIKCKIMLSLITGLCWGQDCDEGEEGKSERQGQEEEGPH